MPQKIYSVYDADNLYLAFECQDSYIDNLVANITTRDGSVWKDDCIEIFLDTSQSQFEYYHFIINPKGVIKDSIRNDQVYDLSWNSDVKVKTHIGEHGWVVEMAFPVSTFDGEGPEHNKLWNVNFNRQQRTYPEGRISSAWQALEGGFHQPTKFKPVIFFDPSKETDKDIKE